MSNNVGQKEITIANGATNSSSIRVVRGGGQGTPVRSTLVGLIIPASFTTADLTLQGSLDDVTFRTLYAIDRTAFAVLGAQADDHFVIEPLDLVGVDYLRLVSSLSQGGARVIIALTQWAP